MDLEADSLSDGGGRRRTGGRVLLEAEPGCSSASVSPLHRAKTEPPAGPLFPVHALCNDVVDVLLDEGALDPARDFDALAVVVQAVLDDGRDAVRVGRLGPRRELCERVHVFALVLLRLWLCWPSRVESRVSGSTASSTTPGNTLTRERESARAGSGEGAQL